MHFLPIRSWLILAISSHTLLTHATPTPIASDTSENDTQSLLALNDNTTTNTTSRRVLFPDYSFDDYTTSGNYHILLCSANKPNSKASQLQALLPIISQNLRRVVLDVKGGTAFSRYGYGAFFKKDGNRDAVVDVFQKIINGNSVPISAERAMRLGSSTMPPSFACIEEGDDFTAELYAKCEALNTASSYAPLMTWASTEVIVICPSFWTLRSDLAANSCPRVVKDRAVPNDDALIRSMYSAVVRMLVNVYLPESLAYGRSKVKAVQDVIELNETASLLNANTYGLYAGGKCGAEFFS